ncbi:hypothetical protein DICPUDRAFT_77338 [Dictyostelium purpureum]|uniref:F-box domain-containing protein n=1 Tax=Dictyostelium purpureum TaxID=5786 RepID=F0ZGB5_DICPU|nr:uncharacterized protein DICPUDRAFT_77338 [Dictyostelium purpureum]EGC37034.1 hypothetical protein DICPUDRAFT_77338 [Dictyostelium purpureum]|eukprot:XP_003286462.1 hypothetical protein DICPUDRAFT_77338 [Dictyostelium purpureum]
MKRSSSFDSSQNENTTTTTIIQKTNRYYNVSKSNEHLNKPQSNLIPKYSLFHDNNSNNGNNNNNNENRPNKIQKTLKITNSENEKSNKLQDSTSSSTTNKYYNYNLVLDQKPQQQNKKFENAHNSNNKSKLQLITKPILQQQQQQQQQEQEQQQPANNLNTLPLIIQKEIIFLLVDMGYFLTGRKVCKYWKKVCHGCLKELTIYFTDIHLSASVKHVSEIFVKSLNSEYLSLSKISFINGAKNSISYSEFYFNNVILPFIENIARYNQNISVFCIKGFPISRINNKTSQQLSHTYKLYHSSSTAAVVPVPISLPSSPINTSPQKIIDQPKGLYFYLTNNSFLKTLSLKNINLDSRGQFDFFSSLSSINTTLESLTISDGIGDEGMQLLSDILEKNLLVNLKKLGLQKNQFTNTAAGYLNKVLLSSESKIEYLDISGNRIDEQGFYMMKGGLRSNVRLKTLILAGNKINNTDDIDFGNSITHLDLKFSMVATKSVIRGLSQYLSSNSSITHLDLSYNHCSGSSAIKKLSKALCVNQTIKHLDLSFNKINTLTHLIDALLANSIESLSLQSNSIDNQSAILFSKVFTRISPSFSMINLSSNKIGIGGFKKISSLISKYSKSHIIYNDTDNNNSNNNNICNNNINNNINSGGDNINFHDGSNMGYKIKRNYNEEDLIFYNSLNNNKNDEENLTSLKIDFSLNQIEIPRALKLLPDLKFKSNKSNKSNKSVTTSVSGDTNLEAKKYKLIEYYMVQ